MALSRYAVLDAYTLEELRRSYYSFDTRGRIRLLRTLSRSRELPNQIIDCAIKDSSTEVRRWVAQHVNLSGEDADRLRSDSDEFVRTCLWENPSVTERPLFTQVEDWVAWFKNCSGAERLAMMRNPSLHDKFVEMLFNPEDKALDIDMHA